MSPPTAVHFWMCTRLWWFIVEVKEFRKNFCICITRQKTEESKNCVYIPISEANNFGRAFDEMLKQLKTGLFSLYLKKLWFLLLYFSFAIKHLKEKTQCLWMINENNCYVSMIYVTKELLSKSSLHFCHPHFNFFFFRCMTINSFL